MEGKMASSQKPDPIEPRGSLPTNDGYCHVLREQALAKRRLEHVAKAIHFAQWDEPFPREGTIDYAMAMQMAVAATEALAEAMEMTS